MTFFYVRIQFEKIGKQSFRPIISCPYNPTKKLVIDKLVRHSYIKQKMVNVKRIDMTTVVIEYRIYFLKIHLKESSVDSKIWLQAKSVLCLLKKSLQISTKYDDTDTNDVLNCKTYLLVVLLKRNPLWTNGWFSYISYNKFDIISHLLKLCT